MSYAPRLSLLVALCLSACATHKAAPPTASAQPRAHNATFADPPASVELEEPPPPLAEWDGPEPEELGMPDAVASAPDRSASLEPADDAPARRAAAARAR